MLTSSGVSTLIGSAGPIWAIAPTFLADFEKRVQEGRRAFGGTARPNRSQQGATAVLPLYGVLTPRREFYTGTALTDFNGWLDQAAANPSVGRIVIDIDSPGGAVYGVEETAALIRQAKASKPVIAVANSMAASAAYWIGSAASKLYIVPSGEVGSIGVFALHEDISEAMAEAGVKVSIISAGKYKVEGNPFEPLGNEARAEMQRQVDHYFGKFIADVATGRKRSRKTVRDEFGQGRMVEAERAVRLGMADGVATLGSVIGGGAGKRGPRRKVADRLAEAKRCGPNTYRAEIELMLRE
jgi:signal peptide peptidase SppA